MKDIIIPITNNNGMRPGHTMCPGCGTPPALKPFLEEGMVNFFPATGCTEVSSTTGTNASGKYGGSAYGKNVSVCHITFETASANAIGAEAAKRYMWRNGTLPYEPKKQKSKVLLGDGALQIGFQSFADAVLQGEVVTYIINNNHGFQNTGVQRSFQTPLGAVTTMTPEGGAHSERGREIDLLGFFDSLNPNYTVQIALTTRFPRLLEEIAQKTSDIDGPCIVHILTPCPLGWKFEPRYSIAIADLAVDTGVHPLVEIIKGEWTLLYDPGELMPVMEYLRPQGRFDVFIQDHARVQAYQDKVLRNWEKLLKRCGK